MKYKGKFKPTIPFLLLIFPLIISLIRCEWDNENKKITDIDGNTCNTVKLGNQRWMVENLATTKYNDGKEIPHVTDNKIWDTLSTPAYCWYDHNKSKYKDDYGALYNWYTVKTGKLCPDGWHVPSDEEWKELEMYLGMNQYEADNQGYRGTNEGSKLAGNASLWDFNNITRDLKFGSSGFSAAPGGFRGDDGIFDDMGESIRFWSSIEGYNNCAWIRELLYNIKGIDRGCSYKNCGISIRCVKD